MNGLEGTPYPHPVESDDLTPSTEMYRSERGGPKTLNKGRIGFKEMTPTSARVRVRGGIRVQGQGYIKQGLEQPPDGAAAASSTAVMMPQSYAHASEAERDFEDYEDEANPVLVEELLGINRTLEKQIETLRLRLEYGSKHYESQKQTLMEETGVKLKAKANEVSKLKEELSIKDATIRGLSETNEDKKVEIHEMKKEIDNLNEEVSGAKEYANSLVSELATLTRERDKMPRGEGFESKDKELSALRKEVSDLRLNLTVLESELVKARDVITNQTGKIKFMETDKNTIQLKFKEELAKVSYSMRLEVEKMRDVMKSQWQEMKMLREQNLNMSRDIKDIRSLLINGCLDDDTKAQQQQQQPYPQPSPSEVHGNDGQQSQKVALPQSARGGKTVHTGYMGALKPSLPVLNRDAKKNQRRK